MQIFGSPNSRFFVVQRDNRLAMFRMPEMLWNIEIADLCAVYFVSNSGDVFFRTKSGFYHLSAIGAAEPVKASWEGALRAIRPEGSLNQVRYSMDGSSLFLDVTSEQNWSGGNLRKLFSFGASDEDSKALTHELMLLSTNMSKLQVLPKKVVPCSPGNSFVWDVSPEFLYVARAISNNKSSRVELYRISSWMCLVDFELKSTPVQNIWVDDAGRIAMQLPCGKDEIMVTIRDLRNVCHSVRLPADAQVLRIWKDKICWLTDDYLCLSNFRGDTLCKASRAPLDSLGIFYSFFINMHNEIDLLMVSDQSAYLTRIDPDNLAVDAKRWEYVAQLRKDSAQEMEAKAKREAQELEERRLEREQLSRDLATDLHTIMHEPSASEPAEEAPVLKLRPTSSRAGIVEEIKDIRLRFLSGEIERDFFVQRLERLNERLAMLEN